MIFGSANLDAAFENVHGVRSSIVTPASAIIKPAAPDLFDSDPNAVDWQFEPVGFKTFCEDKEHMHLLPKNWKEGEGGALSDRQFTDCISILGNDPKTMFDPAVRKVTFGGLLWAKGCIDGDTLIFDETSKKAYSVREIVDRGLIISVKAYDVEKKKVVIKQVARVFSKGIAKRLKITLKSGRTIIVSPDHKFYDGKDWIRAGDLVNGTKKQIACRTAF